MQYSQSTATHLVCVYGKPQIGKTTLILNMIGLKDEECKKEVAEVLRGGVARGNSSTSTAIIYSQSDTNLYGVRIETLEGAKTATIEYCTSDEMCQKIQSVRNDVEKNVFSNNSILHIFIPKFFFSSSLSNKKISILDLPGVESRNAFEKTHVESLMARYIPISSVCIIACQAREIQSLEVEEMPNGVDWKKLPHKYLVVITRSYSNGIIKRYFNKPREQREEGFLEYVQKKYKKELSKILGNNNTKVFPLDMGHSFEKLLTTELKNEEDRCETRQTREAILSSLHESIIQSKGEQLLSTIKELRVIVEQSDENKLSELKKIKQDLVEKENRKNRKLLGYEDNKGDHIPGEYDILRDYENNIQKVESDIDTLRSLCQSIDDMKTTDVPVFSQSLIRLVNKIIEQESLFKRKRGKTYFHDKKQVVLESIYSYLSSALKVSIVSKAQTLLYDCKIDGSNLNVDLYDSKIARSIYVSFVNQYKDKLYPSSTSLLGRLKDGLKDIFSGDCKVYLDDARGYIGKIESIIHREIISSVIIPCKNTIREETEELIYNKNYLQGKIEERKTIIECLLQEIDDNKIKIKDNEKYMKIVEAQKEQDIQTLNTYLKYAEVAYKRQRNDILNIINSTISSAEKLLYVLFLGVVDRDYETIKSTSNG